MHNAKRTINRILFQKIDSRKDELYHNRQENANYSDESRLLKDIHSKIQKKIIIYIDHKNFLFLFCDKKLNQRQLR